MLGHILGWLTVTADVGLGLWLTRYLYQVGRYPNSWNRGPRAPGALPEVPYVADNPVGYV